MKFIVEREMFSKSKTGEQFPVIVVSKYHDYEKANKALREDRGFEYTKAAIRAYYGKEKRGVFWIRESEYAKKFPEEYAENMKANGLKPIGKGAPAFNQKPAKKSASLDELIAQRDALTKQIAKMRRAAK